MSDSQVRFFLRMTVLAGLALVLSACGGMSRYDRPAEVHDRSAVPSSPDVGSDVQIAAYTPPAQPQIARPQPRRAVTVLMKRADEQRKSGDLDGATVSLERALRISPEDAVLWHELAEVRMAQRQYDGVIQLAAKSNVLASPQDAGLRGSNWRLIAQARRAQGDLAGARDAERRAASLP